MGSESSTADAFLGGASTTTFRGWAIFAGIASLVLGAAAVSYDTTVALASMVVFGWLLVLVGVIQMAHAFQVRRWSGFSLYLLDGIIRATVGALLMIYPEAGVESLTLILSFYFVVGGLFKACGSALLRFPGWGWSVASGVVSVALGVMLAMQWPASGTWFIGFAVGVDLILYGWALLMFAAAVRKLPTAFA